MNDFNFVSVKNKRILRIAHAKNTVISSAALRTPLENGFNEKGHPCAKLISKILGFEVLQREVDYCCALWGCLDGELLELKNPDLFSTHEQCRWFYPSWD